MGKSKPPCFGAPNSLSPACRSCGVRVDCFERNYGMEDVPVLIAPRTPAPRTRRVSRMRYAAEKPGAKPWEKSDE